MVGICITGGPTAQELKITTEDGTPITGVFGLQINCNPGEAVTATVQCYVKKLDLKAIADFHKFAICPNGSQIDVSELMGIPE